MWQYWLIAAGIFFVGEMFTAGFLIFWLGIAALITMVLSFFVSNLVVQMTVFIIASVILIFATKPFVKKFVHVKETKTNAFSIIGKKALVIKNIDPVNENGQIKVNGETWTAIGENDDKIEKGKEVEVVSINGVKAVVKPILSK